MTTTTADKGELLPLPEGECCEWLQHGRRVNAFPYPKKPMSEQSDYERKYWVPKRYDAAPLFTAKQMREYALANMIRPTNEGQDGLTEVIDRLANQHLRINPMTDQIGGSREFGYAIARHLSSKQAAQDAWQKIAEGLAKERESIKEAICWPDEWDSVCYDTLDSALLELFAWFKASKEIEADDKQADHIGEANKMVKADAVKMPEPVLLAKGDRFDTYGYTEDHLQAYATAHTAEAVRELVEGIREWIDATPGYCGTLRALLAKYAPSQEGKNGG